ncbi:MAG: hypothetical protein M1826_005235 [Phylliscum demangeonii]|nr:MAG: hypothetical protein M1826_005235 [Phylliscum demangeonii]
MRLLAVLAVQALLCPVLPTDGDLSGAAMREPIPLVVNNFVRRVFPFAWKVARDDSPPHLKQQRSDAVSKGIDACQGKLPATRAHRPVMLPVHEGAPGAPVTTRRPGVAEGGGTSSPLQDQYRHPATHRAAGLLHPWARIRQLVPALLREMRPAVQRMGAALERCPRMVQEYK